MNSELTPTEIVENEAQNNSPLDDVEVRNFYSFVVLFS